MNLLIDLGSIKTGGGVQLALNFIDYIKFNKIDYNFYYLLPQYGLLSSFSSEYSVNSVVYPDNYVKRMIFEKTVLHCFVSDNKIDRYFTFFGSGLPKFGDIKSLVSVAYPIICYPDSEYWNLVPRSDFYRLQIINSIRRSRIRKADMVLAETKVMADRLVRFVGVSPEKVQVIPPVPTVYVEDVPFRGVRNPRRPVFLFLSGLDFHKNLWRLPEIAKSLIHQGLKDFVFKISVSKADYLSKYSFIHDSELLANYFEFLGHISPDSINIVYSQSDFMVNFSYLESFSNNYMEAWKSGLPLIVLDTDFSRHICGDSAVYFDFEKIDESCLNITKLIVDEHRQKILTVVGKEKLSQLPTLDERVGKVFQIVERL